MTETDLLRQLVDTLGVRAMWYPFAAILATLLLTALRKNAAFGVWFERLPERIKWIPATLIVMLGAFTDAYATGEDWRMAIALACWAMVGGGFTAVGAHRVGKELFKGGPKAAKSRSKSASVLLVLCMLPAMVFLPSCAGVVAALPAITAIGTQVLALLQGIDAAVQENFRVFPQTPQHVREEYAFYSDKVLRSYRAALRAAEGGKSVSDGDVRKALEAFYQAYNEFRGWLLKQRMMDREGRLLVAGKVVSEVPPASELRLPE